VSIKVRQKGDKPDYWIFIAQDNKRRSYKIGSRPDAEAIASELTRNRFFANLMEESLTLRIHNLKLLRRIAWLEEQVGKETRRKGPRVLPMVVFGD
jgi:hypothetical protein